DPATGLSELLLHEGDLVAVGLQCRSADHAPALPEHVKDTLATVTALVPDDEGDPLRWPESEGMSVLDQCVVGLVEVLDHDRGPPAEEGRAGVHAQCAGLVV